MADETPAPLSDAEIERIRHVVEDRQYEPGRMNTVTLQVGTMRRILATLDAYREVRGQALADIARLADERDTARRTLAALEAENAAMREIVAAVANENVTLTEDSEWSFWNCGDCGHVTDNYAPSEPVPGAVEHALGCIVTRARALLATQTPATGATAVGEVYTDRADHEHDWRQIESRTAPDVEGHLIVWHRTRCHVCGLISELSINPWTGATTGEEPCELCNGTGIYAQPVAWEDPDGTTGSGVKRITCHGCNGTGKWKASTQTAGEEGEA